MANPTKANYEGFNKAYSFFNKKLFAGALPPCLITMQRKNRAYGYFAGERFGSADDSEITDEIALNPSHFKERGTEMVLSTLVHEMVHLWQHHHGKPSRAAYHNKEWAAKMRDVGLIPSSTGEPGGKETGQSVSHYIEVGGRFETVCRIFVEGGFTLPYVERWAEGAAKKKKKAASKTKYSCPCCDLNAWGKPDIHIVCGECEVRMEPEDYDA